MTSDELPVEVLIADDEPIARYVLRMYLENLGCRVAVANDGDEALTMLRDGDGWIGLVILDARMPGPHPVELYRLLRQIDPSVPILYCSGLSSDDPLSAEIEAHDLPVLTKPFNQSDLQQAILQITKEQGRRQMTTAGEYHISMR